MYCLSTLIFLWHVSQDLSSGFITAGLGLLWGFIEMSLCAHLLVLQNTDRFNLLDSNRGNQ